MISCKFLQLWRGSRGSCKREEIRVAKTIGVGVRGMFVSVVQKISYIQSDRAINNNVYPVSQASNHQTSNRH